MSRRTTKSYRLPEPVDLHRDEVIALCEKLGHDSKRVLRIRIGPREVQVDLLPPRRDIAKLTITHAVVGPEDVES